MSSKVNDHLGFAMILKSQVDLFVKYSDKPEEFGWPAGYKYLGKWSKETQRPQGSGICISSTGDIRIGYFNNGVPAPGTYITFGNGGDTRVGDCYVKNGNCRVRGTEYKANGTTVNYDNEFWNY